MPSSFESHLLCDAYIARVNAVSRRYTWPDFALRYFQGGSNAPKQGTATLKRGTKPSSPSEAMSHSNKPIKESLLPLKFELQKLAVQIYSKLLLYLENGPPSKQTKSDKWLCVQFVQHQAITVPDIRDEIYCQIMKMTYVSPPCVMLCYSLRSKLCPVVDGQWSYPRQLPEHEQVGAATRVAVAGVHGVLLPAVRHPPAVPRFPHLCQLHQERRHRHHGPVRVVWIGLLFSC